MNKPAVTAIAALLTTLGWSAHANLITNGGFETGNLNGWTVNVGTAASVSCPGSGSFPNAHSGNCYAVLEHVATDGRLSQIFADTPA